MHVLEEPCAHGALSPEWVHGLPHHATTLRASVGGNRAYFSLLPTPTPCPLSLPSSLDPLPKQCKPGGRAYQAVSALIEPCAPFCLQSGWSSFRSFYSSVAASVEQAARQQGYNVDLGGIKAGSAGDHGQCSWPIRGRKSPLAPWRGCCVCFDCKRGPRKTGHCYAHQKYVWM